MLNYEYLNSPVKTSDPDLANTYTQCLSSLFHLSKTFLMSIVKYYV